MLIRWQRGRPTVDPFRICFLPARRFASYRRVKASVPQQRIELSVGDNGSGSGEFIDFDALDRREAAAARLRAAVSVS